MEYVFIINPVSNGGRNHKKLVSEVERFIVDNPDLDCKMYFTSGEKDATVLADYVAREAKGDIIFFACGGDGTVQEVANGMIGHDNAILGIIPVGSGNDLVRQLGGGLKEGAKYRSLYAHLNGEVSKIDLIKMSWMEGDEEKTRYVVNGINIGFDGNAAILKNKLALNPYISGPGAYIMAVARTFAAKKGETLKITVNNEDFYNGKLLLATVGNGGFCGGGFHSLPRADLYDGLLELLAVKDITRRSCLSLIMKYKEGKILDIENREKVLKYTQAKSIVIEPLATPAMQFVGDGEVFETGALKIEVVPKALKVLEV